MSQTYRLTWNKRNFKGGLPSNMWISTEVRISSRWMEEGSSCSYMKVKITWTNVIVVEEQAYILHQAMSIRLSWLWNWWKWQGEGQWGTGKIQDKKGLYGSDCNQNYIIEEYSEDKKIASNIHKSRESTGQWMGKPFGICLRHDVRKLLEGIQVNAYGEFKENFNVQIKVRCDIHGCLIFLWMSVWWR